jgi:DNA-binding transcriptional ArsR family regulator
MRPTARRQSALRAPLNDILATEANVRILRALTAAKAPMSAGELARRTLLQRSSVSRALRALAGTNVIERLGTGGRTQVQLWDGHPLAPAIRALFAAERTRAESLVTDLEKAAAKLRPPPKAVWLEGRTLTGDDEPGDPIVVRVVDDAATIANTTEALRIAVEVVESALDQTIEVQSLTPADLEALSRSEQDQLSNAVSVLGVPPAAFISRLQGRSKTRSIRTHADQDARALALASAVADKLAEDPSLVASARAQIARRLEAASPREKHELHEWDRILRTSSLARLRRFLVDKGERATRLRQTLPFIGVLSAAERDKALAWVLGHTTTAGRKPTARQRQRLAGLVKRARKSR